MTKRFGFTLAEVLITLGIIGVVAAMTIPTLISNTNGAQFKTAYKKALSTLNQAVLMNLAMDDTDFSTLKNMNESSGRMSDLLTARMQSATDISDNYFSNFAKLGEDDDAKKGFTWKGKYKKTCTEAETTTEGSPCFGKNKDEEITVEASTNMQEDNTVVYSFADGTAFGYSAAAAGCKTAGDFDDTNCIGFIDVNGANNPNTVINCPKASTDGTCESSEITDIFPVVFWGQTVEPASDSARAVLFGK